MQMRHNSRPQPPAAIRPAIGARIAARAMAEEIALANGYRERICPALNQQAAQVNQTAAPLDYEALIRCRRSAEQQLEHDNRILFRNSQGFSFYTARGAEAARQADEIRSRMERMTCPP